MKDKQPDIKKQLLAVLFYQNVAGARNVSVKERYFALAQDVGAIHEDKEPKHSKELIWNRIIRTQRLSLTWSQRTKKYNKVGQQETRSTSY